MSAEDTNDVNESVSGESKKADDVLPDWAREKLTKANNEAAKYRTEKNEAVEAAKKEVADSFNSKIEELEARIKEGDEELGSSRHEVERIKASLEAGISADKVLSFADLLKGDNSEELRSHAESLKELFSAGDAPRSSKAIDPSQGKGGGVPLNGDPLLNSLKSALNIK